MNKYKEDDIRTGVANGIFQYFNTMAGDSTISLAVEDGIKEAVKQFLEENKEEILSNFKK